ncbi:helix-turn-helix transcriptional regulator [Terasakiella pusilla]|uniref:helix-turn-helix transcriptional regulator n=1 Tax=Terasakiella pusilla TaxID=64973 RepID=UPI0004908454|nr:YafY family protein [Terasakiella pusilla]
MKKTDRHFKLINFLQGRRTAITADRLADECEVSVRTIYRDIRDLQNSGVPIEGEAGVGYLLEAGYTLPPLTFDVDEIEALVLGMAMVCNWTDDKMSKSARGVLNKIREALPQKTREKLYGTALYSFKSSTHIPWSVDFSAIRQAIRERRYVTLMYEDAQQKASDRRVRPLALLFFGPIWLLVTWCELRGDFRNFRLDRIKGLTLEHATFAEEEGKRLRDYCESGEIIDELRR